MEGRSAAFLTVTPGPLAGIAIALMLTNIRLADQKLWQSARANLSERRP